MVLDRKDSLIVSQLKKNARLPIRDIAKHTNLRPSTVHKRIQDLVKNSVIEKFTVKLDNKAVGENFVVFMQVKVKEDIPNAFFNNEHVKEVFGITGDYDLMLKLKFENIEEFNDFVIKFRKQQNIDTTQTMVVTAQIKEEI